MFKGVDNRMKSGYHKLTDIGERDRVDVMLTNPPFDGEEEKGIQGNFPEDKQTAETALLFLRLIMRMLGRTPSGVAAGILPAVEGGILPPGNRGGSSSAKSAGQDAPLYGNQDGCRYARISVLC